MSPVKPVANRRLIVRLGVVVAVLAVLAASCSQSEDRVSDESEPAASTSQASLSSLSPPSSAAENTASSSSPSVPDTATTLVPDEEQSSSSGSEIAATTTLLSSVTEVAVSEEVVELIDIAVDACANLYELRCAKAVGNLRSLFQSGDGIMLTEDEQSDFRILSEMVHSLEVDAVLSAKYGEEYYRWHPGFLAFRDEFRRNVIDFFSSMPDLYTNDYWIHYYPRVEDIEPFHEFFGGSKWGKYLPDAVRSKLLRIFYDFGSVLRSDSANVSPKSENVASRILNASNSFETHRECYIDVSIGVSLTEILISESIKLWKVLECFRNLCSDRVPTDAVVCYLEDSDIDELSDGHKILIDNNATISALFWNSIKYICAKGAVNDNAFPDDTCHRVAANICEISSDMDSLNFPTSPRVDRSACRIGSALYFQTYSDAKARCYRELKDLLITMDLLSAQNSSCNDASEKCIEFWQGRRNYLLMYYPPDSCPLFRQYYTLEIFWQTIPLICSKNNTSPVTFVDSECYNSIRKFCDSRYGRVEFGVYSARYGNVDFAIYELTISPIRSGTQIQAALCSIILNARTQISVKSNSDYRHLNLIPYEFQENLVLPIDLPVHLNEPIVETKIGEPLPLLGADNNVDNINSIAEECSKNSFAFSESKCVIELWKSCFDLLSFVTSSNIPYFEEYYYAPIGILAIWGSVGIVCEAAWIAELIRIATILSASFPEDYQADNFNQFMQYTVDQAVDRGEGILRIDKNGKAQSNLNREGLSPKDAENLLPLATSIAQLIQPYLTLPTTNQQRDA